MEAGTAEMVNTMGPGGPTHRERSKFSVWLNTLHQELNLCLAKQRAHILE